VRSYFARESTKIMSRIHLFSQLSTKPAKIFRKYEILQST